MHVDKESQLFMVLMLVISVLSLIKYKGYYYDVLAAKKGFLSRIFLSY